MNPFGFLSYCTRPNVDYTSINLRILKSLLKVPRVTIRYHKLRKAFSKFYLRHLDSFLDLHLSISDGFVKTKIYDKRDDFFC